MAEIDAPYYFVLLLWVAAFVVLLAQAWRGRSPVVGLSLTYWFNLAMIHLLGGLIQLLPWHVSPDRTATIAGFHLTGYALAALLLGNVLIAPQVFAWLPKGGKLPRESPPRRELALQYIVSGLVVNFMVAGLLGFVPSLGAVLSGGLPLAAAGFCLLWWDCWLTGRRGRVWLVMLAAFIMPVLTLLAQGFLGFGVFPLASLGFFIGVFYRPRAAVLLIGVLAVFGGLSLYSTYAKARDEIRRAVWGEKDLEQRARVTYSSLGENWGWLDFREKSQLDAIEKRLNQNILLGAAYRNLDTGNVSFAAGETFVNALLALIPRILWPDKPQWAGSGSLVNRFTGIRFAPGTSIGIGHVMELYVNFGATGLLLGYVFLGVLLRLLDVTAGTYLRAGAAKGFIFWFVSGQSLLLVGGNFAEMTGAAAGYAVLCATNNRFVLSGRWSRRPNSRSLCPPPACKAPCPETEMRLG